MNKTDLIKFVADKEKMPRRKTQRVLESLIESVTKALKKKESVTLVGFGTFKVVEKKARCGRNPKTGEKITIKKRLVPKFTPGKKFKKDIAKTYFPPHAK
jgi:DNA-binding protein HU-beta